MGIFEGCMEKTADIVRAAAMAEQIQLFSYYDKEEKLVFLQKKIETEGHSPQGNTWISGFFKREHSLL